MKNLWHFPSNKGIQHFLNLENQTVELNASVLESFRKEQAEVDKEEQVRDAERAALRAMPEFAAETITDMESKSKTEQLEDNTRNRVFGVLEGASASVGWGNEYRTVVQEIRNERVRSTLNLQDVERTFEFFGKLRRRYEESAQMRQEQKDKTDIMRSRWTNWYKLGLGERETTGETEYSLFGERMGIVSGVLDDISKKIEESKTAAETYLDRTVSMLKNGHDALTPSKKTTFLDLVRNDINGSAPTDKLFTDIAGGPDQRTHRLQAYKKLGWNPDYYNQEIEILDQNQVDLRGNSKTYRDAVEQIDPNFENIRDWMQEATADSSPPKLNKLLEELTDHITSYGSINIEDIFENFPDINTIDDSAKFLALSEFLGDGHNVDITKNMRNPLKKKYLAYLNKLEGEERPDNIDSYSTEFQTHHKETRDLFTSAISKISTWEGITEPPTTRSPLTSTTIYADIRNFSVDVATKKEEYDQVSSQLDPNEKQMLDGYFKDLEELVKKLAEVETNWKSQAIEFADYATKISDWNTRKGQLESAVNTAEALSQATAPQQQQRANVINQAEATRQSHLDKVPSKPTFTSISSVTSGLKIKIIEEEAKMIVRGNSFTSSATPWKERVIQTLKSESQKEKIKAYHEQLSSYQERGFDILSSMPEGREVSIDFEAYAHGKNFACDDVLDRNEVWQSNLRILNKTGEPTDAIILQEAGQNNLLVVQKSKGGGINVLIFNTLPGYTVDTALEPNFRFPEHAHHIGEPMAIQFT